ncbi:MAG: hypothetical protein KDE52_12985, partial [Calditrichaeota bacterium]|nr:hypothetical protein [Calditrichota bacterium]
NLPPTVTYSVVSVPVTIGSSVYSLVRKPSSALPKNTSVLIYIAPILLWLVNCRKASYGLYDSIGRNPLKAVSYAGGRKMY